MISFTGVIHEEEDGSVYLDIISPYNAPFGTDAETRLFFEDIVSLADDVRYDDSDEDVYDDEDTYDDDYEEDQLEFDWEDELT